MFRFLLSRRTVVALVNTLFKHQKLITDSLRTKENRRKLTFTLTSVTLSYTGLLGLLFNKENEESIVLLLKKGILAQSRMKYEEAEEFFHEAIKTFDRLNAENSLNPVYRVNIYLYIANLYFETREYDKSLRLFQECLRELIAKLEYERNSEAVIEISLKLSQIFAYGLNSIHDAKVGFEFCIQAALSRIKEYETKELTENLEKALINAKILYVMILQTYGRYLLSLKENRQALSLLEQANILALQLFKQAKITNQQLGSLLNDLALANYGLNNYQKAIDVLNSALTYFDDELKRIELEKVKPDFDFDTYVREKFDLNESKLINLSNKCSSYFALKDFDQANENCRNALRLFNKNNFNQNLVTTELVKEIEEVKKLLNDINKEINKNN